MTPSLTPPARRALMNCSARRGAPLPQGTAQAVAHELYSAGLVSNRFNLTERGARVREQLINEALEAL